MSCRSVSFLFAFPLVLSLVACDGDPPPADGGPDAATPDAGPGPECSFEPGPEETIPEPERYTARWAFEPWISKDISDRDDSFDFVQGFRDRDIPVGVLVIDSPWDTHYTNFEPNPSRYPEFADMVERMHADDVRVVMWVTQLTNNLSIDLEEGGDVYSGPARTFAEGQACDFFVEGGKIYVWWKGRGSAVDFFNPTARQWWHRQQDRMLDMGIDGWKLDFGDSYIERDQILATAAGPIPHQQYSEEYYRDYLAYGQHRRGREFVTMVRAWDESYDRTGRFHARPEHAPTVWMGDNHRDWSGVIDVLDHTFRSALAGYVVLGSDIGGYLDRDQDNLTQLIPFDVEVFQRWVALGAMSPFMQLHGRANFAPWTVDERPEETVEVYRYWATLHHEMVGYWYSITEEAYANDEVIIHPIGTTEAEWEGDWRFFIHDTFLMAPTLEAGGIRDVELPSGARYYDWYDPSADVYEGGQTLNAYDASAPGRMPLFVIEGAIVPVDVTNEYTGLGNAASAGHLTILAWPGASRTFRLHEEDDAVTEITSERDGDTLSLGLSRALRPVIFRVRAESAPATVSRGSDALTLLDDRAAFDAASEGYYYDASAHWLWIKVAASTESIGVEASF